jgi:hypothetical protein
MPNLLLKQAITHSREEAGSHRTTQLIVFEAPKSIASQGSAVPALPAWAHEALLETRVLPSTAKEAFALFSVMDCQVDSFWDRLAAMLQRVSKGRCVSRGDEGGLAPLFITTGSWHPLQLSYQLASGQAQRRIYTLPHALEQLTWRLATSESKEKAQRAG